MMNRRAALAGTGSLLALDLGAKPPPAAVWPQALPVPGGVARLALGAGAARPVAHQRQGHLDVPVLVQGDASAWTAVVGIALAAPPGPACISVQADGADGADGAGSRPLPYTIGTKQYPQQHLTVPPRMLDLPPPKGPKEFPQPPLAGPPAQVDPAPEGLAGPPAEPGAPGVVIGTFTEQP